MRTKVYRFGCLPPTINARALREQLRHAHEYQNDLIAIERGRRAVIRELVDSEPTVQEAIAIMRAATKSTRKAARTALNKARADAREAHADELQRISELDENIRRDARSLTQCYWGTYLDIEQRHQQTRSMSLYEDDAIAPRDPHLRHWSGERELGDTMPAGRDAFFAAGQIGVRHQGKRVTTGDPVQSPAKRSGPVSTRSLTSSPAGTSRTRRRASTPRTTG